MMHLVALVAISASAPAERIAYSCKAGDRTVQVIRIGDVLAYRSFRSGRLELQVPGGRTARAMYSGGGELQASFRNGPWIYVVYERTVRRGFGRHNDTVFEAGVDVVRGNRTVSRRSCDDSETEFDRRQIADLPDGEVVEH